MAPTIGNNANRRRRPRRPRPSPASSLPKERLPVGSLPTPSPSVLASHNHINIIPRHDDTSDAEGATDSSETPVHTNPSYLTETDLGRDLHHQGEGSRVDRQNATFADMTRAGLGPQTVRSDHMASQEPVSLTQYIKFRKPKRGRGYSPMDEDAIRREESVTTGSPFGVPHNGGMSTHLMPAQAGFMQQPVHPVDALGAHFAVVRQTFGRELCTPGELQGIMGNREGEVQFSIDAGGDITAHSWNQAQMQWVSIGHYIYRRQAIEGAIGVRPLKGQKIGGAVPQNHIEHFYALAKQFEEDNNALSPTAFDTGSSRMQQPQPQPQPQPSAAPVPLISPHPQRPSATFKTDTNFSGSLNSAGFSSQQTGLPTMSSFNGPNSATIALQRSRSKMSNDRASVYSMPPPSISVNESENSSPTNPDGVSPLSHRFPMSTAHTTFEQEAPFGYLTKNTQSGSKIGSFSASTMTSDQWQQKLREEEVQRFARRGTLEASKEPIYGDQDSATLYPSGRDVLVARARTPAVPMNYNIFNPTGRGVANAQAAHVQPQPQPCMQPAQGYVPMPIRAPTAVFAPTQEEAAVDEWSWSTLAKGRHIDTTPKEPEEQQAQPQQFIRKKVDKPLPPSPKQRHIGSIGLSQPDYGFGGIERPIYNALWAQRSNDGDVDDEDEEDESEDEEELAKPRSRLRNGHSFVEGPAMEYAREVSHFCNEYALSHDTRTEFLREKAKTLRDGSGDLLSEERVEELANDPLSHLLWGVKLNLRAYAEFKEGEREGDYFMRQWTRPEPELVDNSKVHTRFFGKGKGSATSEEVEEHVLFNGRNSSSMDNAAGTKGKEQFQVCAAMVPEVPLPGLRQTQATARARKTPHTNGNRGMRSGLAWRRGQMPQPVMRQADPVSFMSQNWRRS